MIFLLLSFFFRGDWLTAWCLKSNGYSWDGMRVWVSISDYMINNKMNGVYL